MTKVTEKNEMEKNLTATTASTSTTTTTNAS